jgi:hypothetical protein
VISEDMQIVYRSAHKRLWTQVMLAVAVVGAATWLGGGSCVASFCSEDCDPCLSSNCKCNTVCQHSHATFQATHALEHFELVEHAGLRGATQRTFSEILGLSVERAGGPAWPGDDDVVRFARGVIEVNPTQLARPNAVVAFDLDDVSRYETAIVVQMHQVAEHENENQLSFLFDPRGNLIEIDQVLAATGSR